ncbi:hypothetical protein DIJ64_10320 [Mycobacterium leprae]|uniref:Uncharacterized protein n=1 Tax=Mycobacterium leprae TaxID=1769 RepID=A0AAD0KXA5_MYCLR|nr:hypothetical protein [Mycobacterium leprae]AWV48311.1 hypothetical protein DIJ64_10320 [Mycobacterium leprae]OAR20662.1 hypothetical protein A8144_09720 [Mycobacterium leprae 3125609]OAX70827.1 hypothetical protein A3216_09505 [Mycobacterium leprae 7935681]
MPLQKRPPQEAKPLQLVEITIALKATQLLQTRVASQFGDDGVVEGEAKMAATATKTTTDRRWRA